MSRACRQNALVKITLDQLLVLWLDDEVTVVAVAGRICRGGEAADRVLTGVVDIDADDHGLGSGDGLG